MGLGTMKGNLLGAGRRKGKKAGIRRGIATEIGIVIGIGTEREARIEMEREVEKGKRTVIRIVSAIEIATVVGSAVREGEIEMMMITTEVEIMTGKRKLILI